MKYLIFKKRPGSDDPFLDMFGAGDKDPPTATTQELEEPEAADLRRDPGIADVILSIPLSLVAPVQDAAARLSAASPWGIEAVGAVTTAETGAGVTVAVLDTGIDTNHAAFHGLKFGPDSLIDFTVGDRPVLGKASDEHGHGTHVAGTIFGRDVRGTRIGVAPKLEQVLVAKVIGPNGAPSEAVYRAIVWALERRADVISMSLGFEYSRVVEYFVAQGKYPSGIAAGRALLAFRDTVRLFDRISGLIDAFVKVGRGAVVVAASGNESLRGEDPRFTMPAAPPAAADGFISVGALLRTGNTSRALVVARFSNTGCLLAAPGDRILSAQRGTLDGLIEMSGTSMATPHVAGVAVLWTQRLFPDGHRPPSWARDVERAMVNHAIRIPGQARDDVGYGLVQAPK